MAGKPGLPAGAIDRAARQVIEEAGYGAYFIHRTGHGLGMESHEPPYLYAENPLSLESGMVYTVEPGIYLPGKGGVRIEDDVVVTHDGCESLTNLPRELLIL
jgi:Xaa-Pro dipeptidase